MLAKSNSLPLLEAEARQDLSKKQRANTTATCAFQTDGRTVESLKPPVVRRSDVARVARAPASGTRLQTLDLVSPLTSHVARRQSSGVVPIGN